MENQLFQNQYKIDYTSTNWKGKIKALDVSFHIVMK